MAAALERDCCSICLGDYKDPRILPCQHVFCCQCLLDYVAEKKQINCPNCMTEVEIPPEGVEALPKVVGEPLQESTEPDKDSTEHEDCDVCEKGNQAAFQCFECDKSMCDACKKCHDVFSSNHPIYELKTSDPEKSFCESHPKSFLKFYCKSCKYLICQLCLDDGHHSNHCVLGIEDYFTEKKKLFEDYLTKIDGRLKRISEVTERYISKETKNFDKIMKRIQKIEKDFKSYIEIARHRKKLSSDEGEILSKRLTATIKRLDKPLNKSTNIKDILDLTRHLEAKIETQQKYFLHTAIVKNIEEEMGTLDVTSGRLFSFRVNGLFKSHVFFVGGIHWTVEASVNHADDGKLNTKITLKPFVKEEDKELVESVTADLVFTVTCENDSVVKKLLKTFSSRTDSIQDDKKVIGVYPLDSRYSSENPLTCSLLTKSYGFGLGYGNNLKICFDIILIIYKRN